MANKELGQHFLNDEQFIDLITNDKLEENCPILEIGPGPGVLTEKLSALNRPFKIIEMDERFKDRLKNWVNEDDMTFGDALKVDLPTFIKDSGWGHQNIWLVSNLPYNISVPLIINFLTIPQIKFMTLMVQKEVAERVIEPKRKKGKGMGSLMTLIGCFFESDILCQVPPGAFIPPPKVDSTVLSLVRRETPLIPYEEFIGFEKFIRKLFSNRRKQVGKVLKGYYDKESVVKIFEKLGLDSTRRAETFDVDIVINLYKLFEK